ncbi:MAG: hypothetical protein FWC43_03090 [Planctomycetaceae bacterium]|nr:hypothetical protein [Planctomycetaceae bacterium]
MVCLLCKVEVLDFTAEPLPPQVGQLADFACPQVGQEVPEVTAFELKLLVILL